MKGVAALTHDVKVGGTVGTVGSSHHPLVGDEGAAAEPGVVDEESDLVERWIIVERERESNLILVSNFTCQGPSWCAASWPPTILHIFTILYILYIITYKYSL